MSKIIQKFIAIIVLLMTIYIPISYAIENKEIFEKFESEDTKSVKIFEIDNNEKTIGSTLSININISEVEYSNFKIKLSSSINLNDLKVEDNKENLSIDKEDNSFYLTVDKGKIEIEKICLTYTIPDTLKVAEKFTLTGTILEIKDEEDITTLEETIEIQIVENENKEQEKKNETENIISIENNVIDNTKIQTQESVKVSSISLNNNNNNTSNEDVYNGSNNNYLSNLEISDYEMNTAFTKENTTYFVNIPSTIETLKITTEKEDTSSTVSIYGNTELKDGTNKILISVTAENGNVRIYRIFAIKESK